MRAFVQTEIGEYGEEDIAPPRAGKGEVVLRVRAALTARLSEFRLSLR